MLGSRDRAPGRSYRREMMSPVAQAAPPPPPPFDPLQLPVPPAYWYRASDITVPIDAEPLDVTEGWPSHLVGGTKLSVSAEPAIPSYVETGLAGLPAVVFDGVGQYCTFPAASPSSAWTFYFVLSGIGGSGARRLFDSTTGRLIFYQRNSTGNTAWFRTAESGYGAESAVDQILAFSLGAGGTRVRRNAVDLTLSAGTGAFTNVALGGTTILGASNTLTNFFLGAMSEIIVVPAAHDLATMQQMEAYLGDIYKLP